MLIDSVFARSFSLRTERGKSNCPTICGRGQNEEGDRTRRRRGRDWRDEGGGLSRAWWDKLKKRKGERQTGRKWSGGTDRSSSKTFTFEVALAQQPQTEQSVRERRVGGRGHH